MLSAAVVVNTLRAKTYYEIVLPKLIRCLTADATNWLRLETHVFGSDNESGDTLILFSITKTRPYNFGPLKPHLYIVKMRLSTGVYIIFLILLKNIDCGYSLEPPRRGGSNEYDNLCFEQKYEKYRNFLSEKISFFGCNIYCIFEQACFRND